MTERVFPREAMTAEPYIDGVLKIEAYDLLVDAAAFRPASDLDELVERVRELRDAPVPASDDFPVWVKVHGPALERLFAALRRWDGEQ